jgi:hypothetical protein
MLLDRFGKAITIDDNSYEQYKGTDANLLFKPVDHYIRDTLKPTKQETEQLKSINEMIFTNAVGNFI